MDARESRRIQVDRLSVRVPVPQVEIVTPVYIQSIEIGENRGPFSVVGIKAWDSESNLWQTLYKGEADAEEYEFYKATHQYNKFKPSPFCQTTFKAALLRIELDTYAIDDWNELDYVQVIGATAIKAGVLNADVATQTASVMYLPDADFNGEDFFRFQGCDCAYDSARVSGDGTVTVVVGPVNDKPTAQSSSASVECTPGVADVLTLQGSDVDANDTSSLTFSIDTLPDGASLYDSSTGNMIPTLLPVALAGADILFLANYSGVDLPSSFAFGFVATDSHGAVSAVAASVEVTCRATQCTPGNYFDTNARACSSCPAGMFAPGTAVRSSCDNCAVGTFTASEGSESCGTCAFGQIALTQGMIDCDLCPSGATCEDASSMVVNPGMWLRDPDSLDIYECPLGRVACPGGNATDDRCATGYAGVLCAVCQPGYIQTVEGCTDCSSLKAPYATIVVMAMGASIALIISYLVLTNKRVAAMMEAISISAPFKIYFSTIQILGTFSILLQDVLFQPLKGFFATMSFITDFADLFSGFGLSCANEEMRTFKAKLLISTLVPVMAGVAVAVFFFLRISLAHPERLQALKRARSTAALLVLYVTLPSTATMIFRTFVRDGRALGSRGEHYLIADYAGKPQCTA